MSLVGNLEDLGLGEILQIVSLSRKSGILSLRNQSREGKVFFQNGQVIRATSSAFRENLGDLLLRKGVVDVDTLKKALLVQRQSDPPPRLGQILCEQMNVPKEIIEETVKEQVERIVYSFFAWPEGTFSFELGESRDLAATHLNPLHFMLAQGLNPQWLAMEGSRLLDEKRHRGESLEDEGEEPLLELGSLLGDEFREEPGAEAIAAVADTVAELSCCTDKEEPPPDSTMFNLGAELMAELGVAEPPSMNQKSPGLHLLRGMLEELNNPSLGGGIILLVLRFASEFMNRAIIFLVKEDVVVGLGQFGIELASGSADIIVRRMKIPTMEPSIFKIVLREMAPIKTGMGSNPWDLYLEEQLGGEVPEEVFLGPVLSEGKIVAVLYGDNLPEKKPVGDTAALEIFLSQAGLAMEKALLERRLRAK